MSKTLANIGVLCGGLLESFGIQVGVLGDMFQIVGSGTGTKICYKSECGLNGAQGKGDSLILHSDL